jgi:translation initiation factor IF-2
MSDKVRVLEIAAEAGAKSTDVITKAKDLGIDVKSAQTSVSIEDAEAIMNYILTGKSDRLKKVETKSRRKIQKVEKEPKEENSVDTKATDLKSKENETPAAQVQEVKKVLKKTRGKIKKVVKQQDIKPTVDIDDVKDVELPVVKEEKKVEDVVETPVEKKPDTEVPKPEEQPKKPEKKSPLKRRLGERNIKIVKKKRPKLEPIEEQTKTQKVSLSSIFGNSLDSKDEERRVSKSTKKKTAVKSKSSNYKTLDVYNSKDDFAESSDNLYDEVELIDIHSIDKLEVKEENKQVKPFRTTKPSAFGNQQKGLGRKKGKSKKPPKKPPTKEIKEITIPDDIRVYEFAEKCGKTISEIISVLFGLGMMVTKNDFLGADEIEILGEEFEIDITIKNTADELEYVEEIDEADESLEERPPVVTIMGHVDHGKTSLLDKIRGSKVTAKEAGGITQHIGAYTITHDEKKITFVDTPGHEAFSAIRARGASLTDVIIIVVAADDGVKPQTKEAISHAKASGCPIVVAVNKIDKETANIDMVKTQMSENDMLPVDWGGDIEFVGVSAHTGEGIDELLENILLQAEILELRATTDAKAKAVVVESSLAKGRGPVATVIVQNGTLKIGDSIVADTTYGRVKAITNDLGQSVKELGLSETGQVLGLGEVPSAGVLLVGYDSEKEAKDIATKRAEYNRAKELSHSTKVSLEEMSGLIAEGKIKQLPVIVKADVGGSLEAIKGSLEKIQNEEVKVKIIHSAVGGITESDLVLANSGESKAIILGFNVRPTGSVKNKAKSEGVTINTYTIIYDLIDDIKEALSGMMTKKVREENSGQAEVRDTFVVPKVGTVAGCFVTDGKVIRGGLARIIRDGVITYTGKISSLKRFKDDVKEVGNGYECGIMFENFNDIKVGDYIETFIQIEEKVSIDG